MNRSYENQPQAVEAKFFTGVEVELGPAYGKPTLFVVGLQPIDSIRQAIENEQAVSNQKIEHIYFGANMSFNSEQVDHWSKWSAWEQMIRTFLDSDYWCTLDLPVDCVEDLLEGGLCEHHCFIPMISVRLPYLQQLGYNATIKLDDKGFNVSNPGVWCHRLHDLMDIRNFTSWKQYKDKLVTP